MANYGKYPKLAFAGMLLVVVTGCGILKRDSALDCMERVMYFESNRSSRDGMVAVGSVVMNRVASPAYPDTVCGVVSQKGQFAPGVMSKKMNDRTTVPIRDIAASVLKGERHPYTQNAAFFHAASYNASYNNMHYVVTTGGNAFYERRKPYLVTNPNPLPAIEGVTGR